MRTFAACDNRFRRTWFRVGYSPEEVNAFMEAVGDALRSPTPRLTGADVAGQRFTPVVLRPGYHRDDVDDHLTEAEHLLYERRQLLAELRHVA